MKNQRGVTLTGLLMVSVVLGLVALLAMKAAPSWIEYGKILKTVKAVAADASLKDAPINTVHAAYLKRAEVENITEIKHDDLEITKEDGRLVISFSYVSRVPLFANVGLIFDFEGSSDK